MFFKISVVVCLNILIVLVFSIRKILKRAFKQPFIDKLRDYGARRN